MNLEALALPPWIVTVSGCLAVVGSLVAYLRGHNYMMIPVCFSIGWITLGYFFYAVGVFDVGDLGAMVRSGFVVLCGAIVTGAVIFVRRRKL